MNNKFIVSLFLIVSCSITYAANLGNYGQLYPIAETDMLDFIHARLETMQKNGELEKKQKEITERIQQNVLRPKPTLLPVATQTKVYYYTPKFTVPWNIYDAQGNLIYKVGTSINALDSASVRVVSPYARASTFNETLLFIDADDHAQISYAKTIQSSYTLVKIILIKGNIKDAAKNLGRVYFDQNGTLIKRFGISAVPTIIQRDGQRLKITETPVMS